MVRIERGETVEADFHPQKSAQVGGKSIRPRKMFCADELRVGLGKGHELGARQTLVGCRQHKDQTHRSDYQEEQERDGNLYPEALMHG